MSAQRYGLDHTRPVVDLRPLEGPGAPSQRLLALANRGFIRFLTRISRTDDEAPGGGSGEWR